MNRLNSSNLPAISSAARIPTYKREQVRPGIVHFGVGNFHRAHQAAYCDDLLCLGEKDWGITGISMRSPDTRNAIAPQDFLYTHMTLGDESSYRIIGAILNILVAPEDPAAVISIVAKSQTRIVTTTITEKGYGLLSGDIDTHQSGFVHDLASLTEPETIYGYLAAAIIERCNNDGPALTVICCDNIKEGGLLLNSGVNKLLEQHSAPALQWANQHTSFASSMVDRVSPATDDEHRQMVGDHLGLEDAWPVATESFTQWVIQDNFAGPRPPFDKVGALFVDDVSAYEQMKLRFLNAAHSIISALGYLAGDISIHQALNRPALYKFAEQALVQNIMPVTHIPEGSDALAYIKEILFRFQNQAVPYAVLQVGTDSSQKIQQRWLPTIDSALGQKKDASFLAFSLGAWVAYIVSALSNDELNDPLEDKFLKHIESNAVVSRYLALAGAERFLFFSDPEFLSLVEASYKNILEEGVEHALVGFLDKAGVNTTEQRDKHA
jgi:fructuronate reductase